MSVNDMSAQESLLVFSNSLPVTASGFGCPEIVILMETV